MGTDTTETAAHNSLVNWLDLIY